MEKGTVYKYYINCILGLLSHKHSEKCGAAQCAYPLRILGRHRLPAQQKPLRDANKVPFRHGLHEEEGKVLTYVTFRMHPSNIPMTRRL